LLATTTPAALTREKKGLPKYVPPKAIHVDTVKLCPPHARMPQVAKFTEAEFVRLAM